MKSANQIADQPERNLLSSQEYSKIIIFLADLVIKQFLERICQNLEETQPFFPGGKFAGNFYNGYNKQTRERQAYSFFRNQIFHSEK